MFPHKIFDAYAVDRNGWTKIHHSAKNGNHKKFKTLVDKENNIHLETNDGKNCLHIAAASGHLNLCKTLTDKHAFDAHMTDNCGKIALHYSAQCGSYKLIKFFIDKGTDILLRTKDGENCLHIAAANGHLNLCKTLIKKHKFDVDISDNMGWTAFHHSAKNGSYELIKLFIDKGTDALLKTKKGRNCLHIATIYGHLNLCKILIKKHKFDVNVSNNMGWRALHYSALNGSYQLIQLFIKKGTNILLTTKDGDNCLHIAAANGHLSLCKTLIKKYKFDADISNNMGWAALHHSAKNGSYELIKFFMDKGTDALLKTKNGWNCLHIAAIYGHLNLCKTLIKKHDFDKDMTNNYGWTALHESAKNGSYELMKLFFDKGTDILLQTKDGENCLQIAAANGCLKLCKTLTKKHDFDVNMTDKYGWTALHHSAKSGCYELIKFFVDKGTDILLKTKNGGNCLHIAAANGHLNLCKILITEHSFDVNMSTSGKWTALHQSAKNASYELIKLFVDKGTDVLLKTKDGENCLHIAAGNGHLELCKALTEKHDFDVDITDKYGWTVLHHSAKSGCYELIKFFIDKGTDVLLKTKNGGNCLHIAAVYGHLNLCETLIKEHNFDVNMTNNYGWTVLHQSAKNGSYELIKVFIDSGTDILLPTKDGENCLHIAAANGRLNLCKTLTKKHDFDVGMTNNYGWTALHLSAEAGNYELIKLFIDKGTDILLKTTDGGNCLHIAAFYGHLNLCKTLIKKHNFDVDIANNYGCTALHESAKNGSYELIKFFIDKKTNDLLKRKDEEKCLLIAAANGNSNLCKTLTEKQDFNACLTDHDRWTVLHHSATSGSLELIKFFIDKGADILLKTKKGWNCLHIAAANGHLNLCKTLIKEYDFDVNMTNNYGWTALHQSAKCCNYELIKLFIDKGTDALLKTKDGENCLQIAAANGCLNLCKTLIEKHDFDVDMTDNYGWTALHHSAKSGRYKLIKFFIDKGTDILLKTKNGENCLHIAAVYGHLNLCKTLIKKHDFDVNMTNNYGWTALHQSAKNGSYELIKIFIDKGTDILLPTKDGENCLHIAAANGRLKLCKTLTEKHDFDVNMTNNYGWIALHHSAESGKYELIKFFIDKGTDILFRTKDGGNCLHIAAFYGHLHLCKTLIKKHDFHVDMTNNYGRTALHESAKNGSYELIKFFVDKRSDVLQRRKDVENCLHIAAANGHLNLCKTLTEKHEFDVNMTNNYGWAVLHHSARSGSYELIKFFIDKGTDILFKTKKGGNCLHIAAANGHLNLCKTLIEEYDFDVHMSNNYGWTALHQSAKYGSYELIKFFIDKGSDVLVKTKDGENSLQIAAANGHLNLCKTLIEKHGFDVEMADNYGWTALHCSAENGSYELIEFFIGKGSDVLLKTKNGENCLHIAAANGHLNLCKTLAEKHGFDVDIADNDGWTALHHSAKSGRYELVKFFTEKETDINLQTKAGVNCLHIAAANGHLSLCKTLIFKHIFDVHITDNDGWTALHHSVKSGSCELITFFTDMGSDINLKVNDGMNCLHIAAFNGHLNLCKRFLDKHQFDVHLTNNNEWTALHCSARNGSLALFLYLLEKGSNIYCKTKSMCNVLHISAHNGHYDICEFVLKYFTKDYKDNNYRNQYALNSKFYKNQVFYKYNTIFLHAMDIDGNTYLHLAVGGNQSEVCKLLLKYDTELTTLLNKNDETASDIAKKNDYKDVMNALKGHFDRIGMLFIFFLLYLAKRFTA